MDREGEEERYGGGEREDGRGVEGWKTIRRKGEGAREGRDKQREIEE